MIRKRRLSGRIECCGLKKEGIRIGHFNGKGGIFNIQNAHDRNAKLNKSPM